MFDVVTSVLSRYKFVLLPVCSAVVSSGITYVVTKRFLEEEYANRLAIEIEETKRHYNIVYKREEFDTVEKAVEALTLINEYRSDEEQVSEIVIDQEALEPDYEKPETFDYDAEVLTRTPGKPYVITDEEYNDNESGYSQVTLTYYAGDDVLSDDRDQIVPDVNGTIGSENLDRFGHGSNDDRIVYVRNDGLEIDAEVLLHDGDYAEVVHGIVVDEPKRKSRKPRGDDG